MAINQAQTDQVARLFAMTPDASLRQIERALAEGCKAEAQLEPVYGLAQAERTARDMARVVFDVLIPLSEPMTAPKRRLVARADLVRAWRVAAAADPALCAKAKEARATPGDDRAPVEYDAVCRLAADQLGPKDSVLQRLLRLTPVLRRVRAKLIYWVDNLNGDQVAALRLAFKDAIAIEDDGGGLFWEAVFCYLDRPWQVIRLISAVADRPSDRFMAESELASIGERLLAEIDGRLADLKRFDAGEGEAAGAAAAHAVTAALLILAEFEEWLTLRKDGPWGARIAGQRQALAMCMEARLREVEPAAAAALPLQSKAGRTGRPPAKLVVDPQPVLVTRAEAFITLMEETRGAAPAGGFASLRAKTLEALSKRLEQYCDDLIDSLRRKELEDPVRGQAYLEVATRLIALSQGPQAAQIIRRRAAAA